LLLLVVDVADPEYREKIDHVHEVLEEIGAGEVPIMLVYNKIDAQGAEPKIEFDEDGKPCRAWVSAKSGAGVEALQAALAERLSDGLVHEVLCLGPNDGRLRSQLYAMDVVLSENYRDDGNVDVEVRMPRIELSRLLKNTPKAV
jgi:GTP-binding protein HflX